MSCPDWNIARDRRDEEPELWTQALAHYDDCDRCRDAALAAEPTLLFRQLPAPKVDADEIESMKQAVAAMRRSARYESRRATARPTRAWGSTVRSRSLRAAAVAAVLASAVWLQGSFPFGGESHEPGGESHGTSEVAPAAASTVASANPAALAAEWPRALEQMPLIEAVDPAFGSVVEVVNDEVSMVLVLPNTVAPNTALPNPVMSNDV